MLKPAVRKFRRGDSLAVVLDHDAARRELLGGQEGLDGARQVGRGLFAVGNDVSGVHVLRR